MGKGFIKAVSRLQGGVYLKHVPNSTFGQVEPAPVGLRGVHLLILVGLLLRRSNG